MSQEAEHGQGHEDSRPGRGEHEIPIFVNGRKKSVAPGVLSFEQLVSLAFDPVPTGPNILFTMTYRHGPKENPDGNLFPGGSVVLKPGMVFNVSATDKS